MTGRGGSARLPSASLAAMPGATPRRSLPATAFLARVATRVVNELYGVDGVTFGVASKTPGMIEWERGDIAAGAPHV